ncbi:TMUB2 family protein [Megaselia abdita]
MSSSIKLYKALSLFCEEYIQPFDANSCLVIVAILTIVYFAWTSTEVTDVARTVLIFDSHRFRRHNSLLVSVFSTSRGQQSPQETVESTVETEGQTVENTSSSSTVLITPQEPTPPTVEQAIDEVYTLTEHQRTLEQMTIESLQENIENVISETFQQDSGPQEIIREMDRDRNDMELRYRPSTSAQARSLEADNSASTENCSNENSENEQISKTRSIGDTSASATKTTSDSEFTVKLKYLNDDVKIVKAKSSEALNEFKLRNFSSELEAQKIVRLVFNGQVLSPDSKTLQSCGLFDNCVVHCLVHTRKVQPGSDSSPNSNIQTSQGISSATGTNTNSNGNGILDLLSHRRFNTVFNCLSCLTVMFCWFCR